MHRLCGAGVEQIMLRGNVCKHRRRERHHQCMRGTNHAVGKLCVWNKSRCGETLCVCVCVCVCV